MNHVPILALLLALPLVGCVQVAQEEPIEINMNIKIEHEIKVQVDEQLEGRDRVRRRVLLAATGGTTMRNFPTILALCLGLFLTPATLMMASPLDDARNAGTLGEQRDGYVGFPSKPSDATKALAKKVNAGRKKQYQKIAKDTGAPVSAVAAQAGAKLIQKAASGHYVQDAGGGWKKKP